jgi:hypothetical protein
VRVAGGTTVVSGAALRVAAVVDERGLRRGREPLAGPLAGRLRDCLFVGGILYNDKTYRTVYNSNEKGLYRAHVLKIWHRWAARKKTKNDANM